MERKNVFCRIAGAGKIAAALLAASMLLSCAGNGQTVLPWQEDIRVADMAPVDLGRLDVGTIRAFANEVSLRETVLQYHPRTDAVTLEFGSGQLYRQYWTRRMREAFIAALAKYETAYAARDLPREGRDATGRAYGSMTGKIEWRLSSITREYQAFPLFDLGYRFENSNPYFTVTQRIGKDDRDQDPSKHITSGRTVLYFTRAMAQELANRFDDETLNALLPDISANRENAAPSRRITADTYQ